VHAAEEAEVEDGSGDEGEAEVAGGVERGGRSRRRERSRWVLQRVLQVSSS